MYLEDLARRTHGSDETDVGKSTTVFPRSLRAGTITEVHAKDEAITEYILRNYLKRLLRMAAEGDTSNHWVCYATERAMCDEHLI